MRRLLRYPVDVVAVGAIYGATAALSLRVALVNEVVTPVWPPTGIALVALLVLGRRVWLGIALGALLVNLPPRTPSVAAAAGIALGNTLAPVVAAELLRGSGTLWPSSPSASSAWP
jgi:integral membrane sensor domain MASE1